MKVPLGKNEITPRQRELVAETLLNHRTSYGPMHRRLEELLAAMHGCKHAIFMASGTCALQLILTACKEMFGWEDGAEVIVPATTFIATVSAVRYAGLTPILCDVDPITANIDPVSAMFYRSRNTAAILPVHLLGRAADMTRLKSYTEYRGHGPEPVIIEDCCEAAGVAHNGKPVGSFGIAGAFSSYVCHHFSTGIGGAIVTNNDKLATICRSLMVHGRDPGYLSMDDDDGLDDAHLASMMRVRYHFVRWGHSFRASEMEAALGVGALENELAFKADRYARLCVAADIAKTLAPWFDRIMPQIWEGSSSPLFYPLVCNNAATCRGLSEAFERAGIETRPFMPLLTQPIIIDMFAKQGRKPEEYLNAMRLCETAFLIGCHSGIHAEEIEHIRATAEKYFGSKT